MMVLVFPPNDALGLMLLYLLVGDLVAVRLYWPQADKQELLRMLPTIVIGIATGIWLINSIDNALLGLLIGIMIVALVCLEPYRHLVTGWTARYILWVRSFSSYLAGFATTIGNSAGPIIAMYFLLLKLNKHRFVGTAAFFFLIVNLIKLPLYHSIGIFNMSYMPSVLLTLPLVFIGTYAGRYFLQWIPQARFNRITLYFTFVAGLLLIGRYFL